MDQDSTPTHSRRTPSPREEALSRPLPEYVPWEELGPQFFEAWGYPKGKFQPEHMAIYGPTGRGKSHFESYLLQERARLRGSQIVLIATKPADKTLMGMGWPIVDSWPPETGWTKKRDHFRQCIFWATADGLDDDAQARQSAKIRRLLEQLWVPKSNTIVVFDEIAYVEQELKLGNVTSRYFREGRSLGITVVATTQRPANVSRTMHSETNWSIFFAPKDEEDAERLAQIAGNKTYFKRALADLDATNFEFLIVHNFSGDYYISNLPKNPAPIGVNLPKEETTKPRQHVS